jgi:hypothetical protein
MEEVWSHDEIAIGSKLICDELHVDKSVTDDISKDQDRPLGGAVSWIGEVGFN